MFQAPHLPMGCGIIAEGFAAARALRSRTALTGVRGEMRARDPVATAAREADKWGFQPPGGESYAMLSERVAGWVESIDRPTLAVTHGGVARVLLGLIAGISQTELPMKNIVQGRALLFEGEKARWI